MENEEKEDLPVPTNNSEDSVEEDDSSEGSGDDGNAAEGGSEQNGATAAGDDDDVDIGFGRKKKVGKRKLQRPKKAPAAKKSGSGTSGPAKRRRVKEKEKVGLERYLDVAAQEVDSDEDEESDVDEDTERMRAARKGKSRDEYQEEVTERIRKENEALRRKTAELTDAEAAKLAERLTEKYKSGAYQDDEEVDQDALGAVAEQANLPDMRDPKLWMLKCKEGQETFILIAILNKFVAKAEEGSGQSMGIMSAFSTGKSVVFIEAYREAQVKQALVGIPDLYSWKEGAIKLVPIPQMTAALRVDSVRETFKRDAYVRITSGVYKGDLANVVDVLGGGTRLIIRYLPRLDFAAISSSSAAGGAGKGRGRKSAFGRGPRPAQHHFDWAAVEEAMGSSESVKNVIAGEKRIKFGRQLRQFGGNFYSDEDGLAYKEVKPSNITGRGEPPSVDELAAFSAANKRSDVNDDDGAADDAESGDSSLLASLAAAKRAGAAMSSETLSLSIGDNVIVVKGDLEGLSGSVHAVNDAEGTFTLTPSRASLIQVGLSEMDSGGGVMRLEIPIREATKTFLVGDHIKIISGVYKGETGAVLRVRPLSVDPNDGEFAADRLGARALASVLLDSGQRTVDVFMQDLSLSNELVTSVTSVDGYSQHDLVEIPGLTEAAGQQQAGCIISLSQREATVLLPTGTVKTLPVAALRGKIAARRPGFGDSGAGAAVDVAGTPLNQGDMVKVLQGDHQGMTGTIKHVFRAYLFLHNFMLGSQNSGIFVKRCRHVMLANPRIKITKVLQGVSHEAGYDKDGQHVRVLGSMVGRSRPGADNTIGKTVRVNKGRFVGRIGVIRNEDGEYYSVELHQAQQKHVTLAKADVLVIGDVNGGPKRTVMSGAGGGFSMQLGGATPMVEGLGGATPMFRAGGMTPFQGGATPMEGGKTPLGGGGGRTPFDGGRTPLYGSSAAAGGRTPLYAAGSQTPGYGYIGGATPMYVAAGGQTPSYAAGSATPSYRTDAIGSQTPMYSSDQLREPVVPLPVKEDLEARENILRSTAIKYKLDIEKTKKSWCSPDVRVRITSGSYYDLEATIISLAKTGMGVSVKLLEKGITVQLQLADIEPLPITESLQETYVLALGAPKDSFDESVIGKKFQIRYATEGDDEIIMVDDSVFPRSVLVPCIPPRL
jgi:transcription elongation factor SPT5